jgi:hypothetical protein
MLIYKDRQDVIEAIRNQCVRKIAQCDKIIAANKANSHKTMAARAERAAYNDVLWLCSDYTLQDDVPHG